MHDVSYSINNPLGGASTSHCPKGKKNWQTVCSQSFSHRRERQRQPSNEKLRAGKFYVQKFNKKTTGPRSVNSDSVLSSFIKMHAFLCMVNHNHTNDDFMETAFQPLSSLSSGFGFNVSYCFKLGLLSWQQKQTNVSMRTDFLWI